MAPQVQIPFGVDTECVNGDPGKPQIETWLAEDVPNWIARTFRVTTQRSSWATMGLSAGGWCAAMATMLHPAQYSAAVVFGGYFRPDFGPYYEAFPKTSPLQTRYDLVKLARHPPPVALWLEASHADELSYSSIAGLLHAASRRWPSTRSSSNTPATASAYGRPCCPPHCLAGTQHPRIPTRWIRQQRRGRAGAQPRYTQVKPLTGIRYVPGPQHPPGTPPRRPTPQQRQMTPPITEPVHAHRRTRRRVRQGSRRPG